MAHADAVFNVAGATELGKEGLRIDHPVYFGTDPVYHELAFVNGNAEARAFIEKHQAFVTYGEDIGRPECPIPPLPCLRVRTRQSVLLGLWDNAPGARKAFTPVCN